MEATVKSSMNNKYDPRQRIVGAIVLVVIAIVFLPMLFSKPENKPDEDKASSGAVMEITSEGKKVFVSRIKPIEEKPAKAPITVEKPKAPAKKDQARDQQDTSALFRPVIVSPASSASDKKNPAKSTVTASSDKTVPSTSIKKAEPVKKSAPAKKAAAPVTTKKTTASSSGQWIVQVGSFSQKSNADKAIRKLRSRGYTVHSSPIKTSKGTVTRVWLGPFSSHDRASRIQASVKRSTGMGAIIKTYNK